MVAGLSAGGPARSVVAQAFIGNVEHEVELSVRNELDTPAFVCNVGLVAKDRVFHLAHIISAAGLGC